MQDVVITPIAPPALWAALVRWLPAGGVGGAPSAASVEAAAPAAPPGDGLPRVAGLDTELGLSRVLNRKSLYLTMLQRFAQGYGALAAQIRAALVSGDLATAQRLAHSVKSVAANVGATGVQQLAAGLETALDTERPAADVQQQLAVLDRELAAMVT